MKRNYLYIICLLLLITTYLHAQKESGSRLLVSNAELTDSTINTVEDCFSLSDSKGNLLFYSDGMTVWNRQHAVMKNGTGLNTHTSSSRSVVILPYPEISNKYIIVSLGQIGQNNITYSIVDMDASRNGGYADGVVADKNIPLLGSTTEIAKGDNLEEYEKLRLYILEDSLVTTGIRALGLPSFILPRGSVQVTHDKEFPVCSGEAITFSTNLSVSGSSSVTKIIWNFGDGEAADDTDISQSSFSQKYTYKKPGTYILTVTPYEGDNPVSDKSVSLKVTILPCVIPVNPNVHTLNLLINK